MTLKAATPYLILNGTAEQAISFYQSALGAKVEVMQRFGDMDPNCPVAMKNRVMHARLRAGDALLMVSDSPDEQPALHGGGVHVALQFDEPEQARRCFDALAARGRVSQPLMDAPWGGLFGALDDEFGTQWMFSTSSDGTA